MVARETAVLAGIGLALGFAGAVGIARLLESRLFGGEPLDPLTYLAAGLPFAVVAFAAAVAPARTATRVDPMDALRYE